ncbi:50S ribosomal protein L3 [Candidatus Gracilibacteria bacterium]|nr:50S ribosomal protein L3 [Candidatus Gracilibacteria bacterium]
MKGILTRKLGMSQFISPESGEVSPVTVLEAPANTVLQVKKTDKDGYKAVVIGAFERKNFGKNDNKKYKFIQELSLAGDEELKKGDKITLESLKEIKTVKVTGTSKGKGFSGVVRKYNFGRGRETHGSHHHREPGSVGTCAKPGRILRGKKMPGQYGNTQVTIRSTEIVDIDLDKNLIALRGSVPGAVNSFIFLQEN